MIDAIFTQSFVYIERLSFNYFSICTLFVNFGTIYFCITHSYVKKLGFVLSNDVFLYTDSVVGVNCGGGQLPSG